MFEKSQHQQIRKNPFMLKLVRVTHVLEMKNLASKNLKQLRSPERVVAKPSISQDSKSKTTADARRMTKLESS